MSSSGLIYGIIIVGVILVGVILVVAIGLLKGKKKDIQEPRQQTMGGTVKFCTNCGAKLADGDKFCAECGNKIA